jgi:deazaflavin-dependent oxidoreductase (nitroreductase family)
MMSEPPRAWSDREERLFRFILHHFSRFNLWVYRRSGGRLLSRWKGRPCIGILTCRGRITGALRATPLLYLRDGPRLVLIASNAGMSSDPVWYRNLMCHPDCEFEIGPVKYLVRARRASANEKRHYWPQLVAIYGYFTQYQARVRRDIPLVILEQREPRQG